MQLRLFVWTQNSRDTRGIFGGREREFLAASAKTASTQIVNRNDCGLVFRRCRRYRYGSVSDRRPSDFLFSHSRLPVRHRGPDIPRLSFPPVSCLLYLIGAPTAAERNHAIVLHAEMRVSRFFLRRPSRRYPPTIASDIMRSSRDKIALLVHKISRVRTAD